LWCFFFKQKTAYEIGVRLVGSGMCIRDRLAERVDCLTQALRLIIDHHAPEEYRGGLTCIACTYLAGIPMSWPCVNRSFVGDLIPDASNRLLPP